MVTALVSHTNSGTATTNALVAQFSDFVRSQTGLHFPRAAWRDLERRMAEAAAELGFADAQACMSWLLTSPTTAQHIEVLARYLTVGETYFFREKPALNALENLILPEIIEARRNTTRRLRIWSAACCTGEEPYTLAIIVSRLLPDWKEWDIKILGTDLNPNFLAIAGSGVYRNWSFRATEADVKERYFTHTADGYSIAPEIKQMVTFARLNLADASYSAHSRDAGNIDIIFCRNALMYFSPEGVAHATSNFYRALNNGGWLVVNPSEATPGNFPQFELVALPDALLFRKGQSGPQSGTTPSPIVDYISHSERTEHAPRRAPGVERSGWRMDTGNRHAASRSPRPSNAHQPRPELEGAKLKAEQQGGLEAVRKLQAQGRHAGAKELLLAMVERGSGDAQVFALLAGIEADLGNLASAVEWSERATRADSMNPASWFLRATILQEQGALNEAIVALKRVLYLDPGFVLAHFVLGHMNMRQGRKLEALRHFNVARSQLSAYGQDEVMAGSDDLTARQLEALIAAMLN